MHIAELIVLPSFRRDQAAQATLGGVGNFGPPFHHCRCGLFGISITWHFFVWPRNVWQSLHIWQLSDSKDVTDILFRSPWQISSSCVLCTGNGQSQQYQARAARHGVTLGCGAQTGHYEHQSNLSHTEVEASLHSHDFYIDATVVAFV